MTGEDKVFEARFNYRVNQLLKMGFERVGSLTRSNYTKGIFFITTVEIGHSSVDEWNKKIQDITDNKRYNP